MNYMKLLNWFFFFRILVGEWVYFVRVFYCVMKVINVVNGD